MSANKTTTKKSAKRTRKPLAGETHAFQAETRQILHLMIHSLYSNKEIFLRELISNASDALDRLRFESLQQPQLMEGGQELQIEIETDRDAGTLTVRDNGIGMTRDEVLENIGTIARSGTRRFLEQLTGDAQADTRLIGQFGVGFYSSFIVADSVTLLTRKAGAEPGQGVRWVSDGQGEFTILAEPLERAGTTVILQLKSAEKEFLDPWHLRTLINRYSDHIGFPIRMRPAPGEAEDGPEWEQVNKATALWALPKNDISEEDYQAFYKHLTHDFDDALCWAHNKVEGKQSYTTLLYLPRKAPLDLLLQRDERHGLRLYVNRVFIMDAAQSLLPHYLRFIRGVVDSQDLPLNISRELLQENELVGKIRSAVIRRALDMLDRLGREHAEDYRVFWTEFGAVLKEGVVEDPANRERILPLLRFSSTQDESAEASTDLAAYVSRMRPGQEAIYYLTAEHHQAARNSPHLEVFRQHGIEVLLLSDRVDEWMMAYLPEFEGKPFKSVSKGDIDLGSLQADAKTGEEAAAPVAELDAELLARIAERLGERVSEVRASRRLTESASCLVLHDGELALHLQKMLRQAGQEVPETRPVLELNARHPLVDQLGAETDDERFGMLALMLYEQALLSECGSLPDPAGFVRRVNALMTANRPPR
jgi:molecular chaperone HtpG